VTDWSALLACTVCEAKMGEACLTLLGRGPQALPSRHADIPHSSRKLRGQVRTPAPANRTAKSGPVERRAAKDASRKVTGWEAIAARQQQRRETR
jgi:hypothetical protein